MARMVVVICVLCGLVASLVPARTVWTLSMEVTERALVSRNVGNSRGGHLRINNQEYKSFVVILKGAVLRGFCSLRSILG